MISFAIGTTLALSAWLTIGLPLHTIANELKRLRKLAERGRR